MRENINVLRKNYIWIPGNFFKQDPVKEIIF